MTYSEFMMLWGSLTDDQKESVCLKAKWEHITLWAVCDNYPDIWNDEGRLKAIRSKKKKASPRRLRER